MDSWQIELREAYQNKDDLKDFAFLKKQKSTLKVESRFQTLVPRSYLALINPMDPEDPIAKMAFPDDQELEFSEWAERDPIGDLEKQVAPRLTHRYPDRALLHVTHLCPMYCRFCFRKNLMNETEEELYSGSFASAFEYLKKNPQIEELILTGGDPLMLTNGQLQKFFENLYSQVFSLKRLRIHTRMPVTLPSRIDLGLVEVLKKFVKSPLFVVTHFNHPREVRPESLEALTLLRGAGALVLNQSVLLKGVNDSREILRELFLKLGNEQVLPYYLHQLDPVSGGEHFRVPLEEGLRLWRSLRGQLPGYIIPDYVTEQALGKGKISVESFFHNRS